MKIKEVKNGKYRPMMKELVFDTENGVLVINEKSALEIAYTLFDRYAINYKPLEELEERMVE